MCVVWCCDKSMKYLSSCLYEKQNSLKLNQGLGYSSSNRIIDKKEIEDIKKDLLNK